MSVRVLILVGTRIQARTGLKTFFTFKMWKSSWESIMSLGRPHEDSKPDICLCVWSLCVPDICFTRNLLHLLVTYMTVHYHGPGGVSTLTFHLLPGVTQSTFLPFHSLPWTPLIMIIIWVIYSFFEVPVIEISWRKQPVLVKHPQSHLRSKNSQRVIICSLQQHLIWNVKSTACFIVPTMNIYIVFRHSWCGAPASSL